MTSPNDTLIFAAGPPVIDAAGNSWSIINGQVAVNGVPDPVTDNVIAIAYANGTIWQENTSELWYSKTTPSGTWTAGTSAVPVPVTSNDTLIVGGGAPGQSIIDAGDVQWTITAGGQVAVDGVADPTTANVFKMVYSKGQIWQENTSGLWYEKTTPANTWSAGTSTAPPGANLPASDNDSVIVGGFNALTDGSGNVWEIVNGQVEETTNPNTSIAVTTIDPYTANVTAMAYVNGNIWQQNTSNIWYEWVGSAAPGNYHGWAAGTTDPLPPSPSGSILGPTYVAGRPVSASPLSTAIVDAKGNLWNISSSGQVAENGKIDTLTSNVTDLAYVNGTIWQENASDLWYAKIGNAPGNYDGWSAGTLKPPVPEVLTWLGGGSNLASNPANWSPATPPAPGDLLLVNPGATINVIGDALQGDTLAAATRTSVPVAPITVNVSGSAAFSAASDAYGYSTPLNINIANDSTMVGGISAEFAATTVEATGNGEFNNTKSEVYGCTALINATVVGTGTFSATSGHGTGTLEFMQGVGAGQTITAANGDYGEGPGVVQVADPKAFFATVDLQLGQIFLQGLTATSYTDQNGVVTLFNGDTAIDSVKLNVQQNPYGIGTLAVSQVGANILLTDNQYATEGTPLPLHT